MQRPPACLPAASHCSPHPRAAQSGPYVAGSELEGLHREVLVRAIKVWSRLGLGAPAGAAPPWPGFKNTQPKRAGLLKEQGRWRWRRTDAQDRRAACLALPPCKQVLEGQGRAKLFKGASGEDEGIKFFTA